MIFTKTFWLEALERATKTAAQTVGTFFTLGALTPLPDLTLTVMWQSALVGAGFSIVTSIGSAPFGANNSPSLVKGEPGLDVGKEPNPEPVPRHLAP